MIGVYSEYSIFMGILTIIFFLFDEKHVCLVDMDNMFDFEGIDINQDLLERTNPIFNTTRMTLFQLAAVDYDDAKAVAES